MCYYFSACDFVVIVVEAALVSSPLNTAVIQGSAVTLRCGSDVSNAFIKWCESYDVTTCNRYSTIYNGYSYISNPLKFNVTKLNNDTYVTRDLNIKSIQLNDAGVYLCEERIPGVAGVTDSRSAQVIVLGNY